MRIANIGRIDKMRKIVKRIDISEKSYNALKRICATRHITFGALILELVKLYEDQYYDYV